MTDSKEIIRALRRGRNPASFSRIINSQAVIDAADLIEQQAAEIGRLREEAQVLRMCAEHRDYKIIQQAAEIERLKEMAELYQLRDNCAEETIRLTAGGRHDRRV